MENSDLEPIFISELHWESHCFSYRVAVCQNAILSPWEEGQYINVINPFYCLVIVLVKPKVWGGELEGRVGWRYGYFRQLKIT